MFKRRLAPLILYNNMNMTILTFIGGIGLQEIIVVALVVLLFFGGKKIPELMRGMGKGVRSFKEGMNDIKDDINEVKQDIKEAKDTAGEGGEKK